MAIRGAPKQKHSHNVVPAAETTMSESEISFDTLFEFEIIFKSRDESEAKLIIELILLFDDPAKTLNFISDKDSFNFSKIYRMLSKVFFLSTDPIVKSICLTFLDIFGGPSFLSLKNSPLMGINFSPNKPSLYEILCEYSDLSLQKLNLRKYRTDVFLMENPQSPSKDIYF